MDLLDALRERLGALRDPELGATLGELGMLLDCQVAEGVLTVTIGLTTAGCPMKATIQRDCQEAAKAFSEVASVRVEFVELAPEAKAELLRVARRLAQERAPATSIPPRAPIITVASGKGGVGKSSVTANLGVALARRGLTVGILDADIWGFSIPRLLGITGPVEARAKKMVPKVLPIGDGELRVLSMGFLAEEDQAVMWRGLILNRAVQQFLEDAHWDDLDYLLIDLPPGTGDVQMGLARMLPRTELLIVTTPPVAAQKVAARAADMARRGNLRVAGVIENMSAFVCDHGTSYALFGAGGGERLAADLGVELLASIPLDAAVAAGGDTGQPVAAGESSTAQLFAELADRIAREIAPVLDAGGCSARMLANLDAAVGASKT